MTRFVSLGSSLQDLEAPCTVCGKFWCGLSSLTWPGRTPWFSESIYHVERGRHRTASWTVLHRPPAGYDMGWISWLTFHFTEFDLRELWVNDWLSLDRGGSKPYLSEFLDKSYSFATLNIQITYMQRCVRTGHYRKVLNVSDF